MEPLWSPVVATGGNRSQNGEAQKPHKQAKTFAVGCDRLPQRAHGTTGREGATSTVTSEAQLSSRRHSRARRCARVRTKLRTGTSANSARTTSAQARISSAGLSSPNSSTSEGISLCIQSASSRNIRGSKLCGHLVHSASSQPLSR
jgi:hypothetical protein